MSFLLANPFLVVGTVFLVSLVIVGWAVHNAEEVPPGHPDFEPFDWTRH